MNFFKYLSLFLVLHSNSSNELDEFIEKMNLDANEKKKLQEIVKKNSLIIENLTEKTKEQFRDLNENQKILKYNVEDKIKKIGNLEQTNSELTAKCINAESESKRFKEENKELKKSHFLPKTAQGWIGLTLLCVGTVLVVRMYHTLYMT